MRRRVASVIVSAGFVVATTLATVVGVADAAGEVTEFSAGISPNSGPAAIAAGPDGNLWFTEIVGESRSGASRPRASSPSSPPASPPTAARAGSPRARTATCGSPSTGDRIGRITTAGVVTEFSAGITAGSSPLAASPRAPTATCGSPSRRRPDRADHPGGGRHRVRAGITPGSSPLGITAGPDGNLWFTEHSGNAIGRITPGGRGHRVLRRHHPRQPARRDRRRARTATSGSPSSAATGSGGSRRPVSSPSSPPASPREADRRGSPRAPTGTSGSRRNSGTASAGSPPPGWSPSSAPRSPPAASRWDRDRTGRQPVVHRAPRQPDRPDHELPRTAARTSRTSCTPARRHAGRRDHPEVHWLRRSKGSRHLRVGGVA